LLYVKVPAPDRDARLGKLLARIEADALVSYRAFRSAAELGRIVRDDLAALLSERFAASRPASAAGHGEDGPPCGAGQGLDTAGAPLPGQRPTVRGLSRRSGVRAGPAATRTLPADVASFIDRRAELAQLRQAVPEPDAAAGVVSIVTIDGMAGVGKTAFAVHGAHELAPQFTGGQFFVRLHGHTPDRRPADPLDVLSALLLEDGVAARRIPADLESRAAMWRDRMADRRALLVLDDASDSDQVRPLLPAGAGSLIVITSRRRLTALAGARTVTLDVMDTADAADLFVRLAGRPGLVPGDRAVSDVTRLCGYLPLAISLMAGQLKHHPSWTAGDLAADLASVTDRTAAMAAERLSVAAAFDLSYQYLRPDLKRLFRRLSLHPGTDTDAYAAAAADDCDLAETRKRLDQLFSYHLLQEPARGRYRFHDLIREHARALAASDPPEETGAAATRLLDYYLHTARAADRHLTRRPHLHPAWRPGARPSHGWTPSTSTCTPASDTPPRMTGPGTPSPSRPPRMPTCAPGATGTRPATCTTSP
jgi:hypothetical protein